jgi:hypothetical protein
MLNTLVHNMSIHKGSQWAVLNATVVYAYGYEGALEHRLVLGKHNMST